MTKNGDAPAVLRGKISVSLPESRYYLTNVYERLAVVGIEFDPEPPRDLMVSDLMCGRSSVQATDGSTFFRGSLLNRLGDVCFDDVDTGANVSFRVAKATYNGTCEVRLGTPRARRSLIATTGCCQISGHLTRVVVTRELETAIEEGDVVQLLVEIRPHAPDYQEVPCFRNPVHLIDGHLVPAAPIWVGVSQSISYVFEGRAAGAFGPADVVGLLEAES